MLTKISNRITDSMIKNNLISAKNKIVSQFGLEMLIAYTLHIISAITLGLILKLPLESILMTAAFIKLRGYNGGAHASNHCLCYILSIITIFASLKTIGWATNLSIQPYFLALLIFPFCGLIFLLLSPVEDKNKPLDDLEKTVYRQRGLTVLSVTLAASLTLIMLGLTSLGYAVGMAIITTGVSMVAGYVKNRIIDTIEK